MRDVAANGHRPEVWLVHPSPLVAQALVATFGATACLRTIAAPDADGCVAEPGSAANSVPNNVPNNVPKVVLIDALGGAGQTRVATRWARRQYPRAKVLVLGVDGEREGLALIEEGASGHLPAAAGLAELRQAIADVLANRPPCTPRLAASVLSRISELAEQLPVKSREQVVVRLTPREDQVLRLIGGGLRNKEIAQRLAISLPTVKNHVHKILDKLGVGQRRGAIRRALALGLMEQSLPGWPAAR